MTQVAAEQAAQQPTQDPSTEQEPVQPAAQPSQGATPWADDLATVFGDEAVRGQVDDFLRQKVQPYVTQLEQSRSVNEDAERLYSAFVEDPTDAYGQLSTELWGEEVTDSIRAAFNAEDDEDETPPTPATPEAPQAELPPEVQELLEERRTAKAREQYDAQLAGLKAAKSDPDLDDELFAPFVVMAEGDMELAYQGYTAHRAKFNPSSTEEVTTEQPPAVIGSDTTSPSSPPTTKKYGSLDEAMDDFLIETKSQAPPVVGAV